MRKLKTAPFNLMISGNNIPANSVISEDEAHPTLIDAADSGRKINGIRLATWLPDEEKPAAPVKPESVSDPEPVGGSEPSLTDLILTLVGEGDSKSAIVTELGKTERWTQAEVRSEFDRMMSAGTISAGDKPGEYRVA